MQLLRRSCVNKARSGPKISETGEDAMNDCPWPAIHNNPRRHVISHSIRLSSHDVDQRNSQMEAKVDPDVPRVGFLGRPLPGPRLA